MAIVKKNIYTIEELSQTLSEAQIKPKPVVKNLLFVYDWKAWIETKFTRIPLENHSFYHSFMFSKEKEKVRLRVKKLPQDTEYSPPTGIQLLADVINYSDVDVADFRIEKIQFPKVFRSLDAFLKTISPRESMRLKSSWEVLRRKIETLPEQKSSIQKMRITDFPEQSENSIPLSAIPDHIEDVLATKEREISGQIYPEELKEGNFNESIAIGLDVVVYTTSKHKRPWTGRVLEILKDNSFRIQWYTRKNRSTTFFAMEDECGAPEISVLNNEVVMFWDISCVETRTVKSFELSKYWLEKIRKEYSSLDSINMLKL